MMEPLSIEQALDRFSELVDSVTTRRERVTIATPEGAELVLMSAEDLEGLEETLEILTIKSPSLLLSDHWMKQPAVTS